MPLLRRPSHRALVPFRRAISLERSLIATAGGNSIRRRYRRRRTCYYFRFAAVLRLAGFFAGAFFAAGFFFAGLRAALAKVLLLSMLSRIGSRVF